MEPTQPKDDGEVRREEDERANELLRRFKEDQARREADQRAVREEAARRREAEERERREQVAARIRAIEIPPGSVRTHRMVVIFLVILIGAIITVNFLRLDASSFESTATARLGTPVSIGSAHLRTLPLPVLHFRNVSIGPEGEVKIAEVRIKAGLRTVLDEKKQFGLIEVQGAQVPLSWLSAAIWGKPQSDTLHVEEVIARDVKLVAQGMELPAFQFDAKFDSRGSLRTLAAQSADGQQKFSIAMKPGNADIQYSARPFRLPFPGTPQFDDLAASGTLTPAQLAVERFDASVLNGSLSGRARLRWDSSWSLDGEFVARSMEPGLLTGTLVPTGRLEGEGTFSLRAAPPGKLREAARLDTSFTVHRGTLGFVDLTRALQGSAARGGTTAFSRLDGNATYAGGNVHVRQVRLVSGLLTASGEALVDAQRNLNARVRVELTSARGAFSLGGTVAAPEVKR